MGRRRSGIEVYPGILIIIEFSRISRWFPCFSASTYPFRALAYFLDRATKRAVPDPETSGQMDSPDSCRRRLEKRSANECKRGRLMILPSAGCISFPRVQAFQCLLYSAFRVINHSDKAVVGGMNSEPGSNDSKGSACGTETDATRVNG